MGVPLFVGDAIVAWLRVRTITPCGHCAEPVEDWPDPGYPRSAYCCAAHRERAAAARRRKALAAKFGADVATVTVEGDCGHCGAPFCIVMPAHIRSRPSYCGERCKKRAGNKRNKVNARRKRETQAALAVVADAARAETERLARIEAVRADRAWENAERAARCPRPDKIAWQTREVAQVAIKTMRANGRPRADLLHAYECECGLFHVGDRTRYEALQERLQGEAS